MRRDSGNRKKLEGIIHLNPSGFCCWIFFNCLFYRDSQYQMYTVHWMTVSKDPSMFLLSEPVIHCKRYLSISKILKWNILDYWCGPYAVTKKILLRWTREAGEPEACVTWEISGVTANFTNRGREQRTQVASRLLKVRWDCVMEHPGRTEALTLAQEDCLTLWNCKPIWVCCLKSLHLWPLVTDTAENKYTCWYLKSWCCWDKYLKMEVWLCSWAVGAELAEFWAAW